ncbi:hypothetical protein DIS24_g2903 [Lasiodiplodia hormozganensis]|uniref:Uncharacterized protein n=1 Tax=Lasiodiplodia hormozganensis TaxID=869390 RepID=A0AA39YZ92_9PEZI|nr:hypothetical protein DIS24_g2903 [Lasiodiplodia hormozganensis]
MYLTDEIFKTADAAADHPYYSPPADSTQHSADHLGKRKRGAGGDEYTTNTVPLKNIKILPPHHHNPVDYPYSSADPTALYPSPPRRKQHARIFAHSRRTAHHARQSPVTLDKHRPVSRLPPATSPAIITRPATADLTACHCCHRAPKQKRDLDNYSACTACGARTCYICMRVCEQGIGCGSYTNGHGVDGENSRRKICRECCIESGPEGETWCFDCVALGEGGGGRVANRDGQDEHEGEEMVMG